MAYTHLWALKMGVGIKEHSATACCRENCTTHVLHTCSGTYHGGGKPQTYLKYEGKQ